MLKLARPFLFRPVREEKIFFPAGTVGDSMSVGKAIRLFPDRWVIIVVINERKTLEFCTNRAMRERRSIIRESLHARLHGESSILRFLLLPVFSTTKSKHAHAAMKENTMSTSSHPALRPSSCPIFGVVLSRENGVQLKPAVNNKHWKRIL